MRIVVTGGHLSPALAVISKLKGHDILFVGRKYAVEGDKALSFEYQTITSLGIEFKPITTARLQRKLTKYTFTSLLKFPAGLTQSASILKSFKPDVVLGFGGYISLPIIFAAYLLRIPVVIHEQTMEAGMANKIASRFASKICISWPSSFDYFPKEKTVLTGNPLREEITKVKGKAVKNKEFTLYVTGGSLGSHFINVLIEKNLKNILAKYFLVHQAGNSKHYDDYDRLSLLKNSLGKELSEKYELVKHFAPNEAAQALNNSDLVISRSGVNTVTELAYLEKPALLIPLPFAQRSEQLKNALFLKDLGLAEVYHQQGLTAESFKDALERMVENIEKYKRSSEGNFTDHSADKIIGVLEDVALKKNT